MNASRIVQSLVVVLVGVGCGSSDGDKEVPCLGQTSCYYAIPSACGGTVISSCDDVQTFVECKASSSGCDCKPVLGVTPPAPYTCDTSVTAGAVCCPTNGFPSDLSSDCYCTNSSLCFGKTQVSSCSN